MNNLFKFEGGLITILSRIADLLILNILFILCCIPIITIGPAITALYSITLKLVKNEEGYIFKGFFKAFKDNFKMSLIVWLILLLPTGVLIFDYYIFLKNPHMLGNVLPYVFIGLGVIYSICITYIFPFIARFENTLWITFKNSILIALLNLPYTLLLVLVNCGLPLLSLFVLPPQYVILLWIFCGFSLPAIINSFIFRKIFAKYEPT